MKTLIASITLLLIVLIGGRLITGQTGRAQQPVPRKPIVQPEDRRENQAENQTETDISLEWAPSPEWEEELPDYFQVIIDNNLFRPLGWTPEHKSDVPFQLVGTILKDELDDYQAVLKTVDTQQIHFVNLNETQNGWRLVMIEPKQVVLEKADRRITLALNEQQLFIHSVRERALSPY